LSISSRSRRHDALVLERRHRVSGIVAGIVVAVMIVWGTAARSAEPQVRVVATGDGLTVEIIDGPHVILIANATSPTDARSALGALNRPWEPQPSVIVADSRDSIANGLWETLERTSAAQLIVLGAPGDSEAWVRIERYCRDAGIELRFLEHTVTLKLEMLTLTLAPGPYTARGFPDAHAVISTNAMRVAVELGGLPAYGRFHALVTNSPLRTDLTGDLVISTADPGETSTAVRQLQLEEGHRAVLVFESERIRVRGGRLIDPPER
jgi:hypothetical protein